MRINSVKELASFISSERKKLKLSQSEVAKAVGIKQQTVSAFENQPERSRLETLFLILSVINLDIQIIPKQPADPKNKKWKHEW